MTPSSGCSSRRSYMTEPTASPKVPTADAFNIDLTSWTRPIPVLQPATDAALKIISIATNAKSRKQDCYRIAQQVYKLIEHVRQVIDGKSESELNWSSGQAIGDLVRFLETIEARLRIFRQSIRFTLHADERIADSEKHLESARNAVKTILENNQVSVLNAGPTRAKSNVLPLGQVPTPVDDLDDVRETLDITGNLKNAAKTVLQVAEKAVDGVPLPGLKGAIAALNYIIGIAEGASRNTRSLQELKERITCLESAIIGQQLWPSGQDIIENVNSRITDIKNQLESYHHGGRISAFLNSVDNTSFLNDCNQTLNRLILDLQAVAQVETVYGLVEFKKFALSKDEDNRFHSIPRVMSAAYNSQARASLSGCMEGTRVKVLDRIDDWISNGEEHIFWVPGMAGTGKTTISHTVAEKYDKRGILGGSFFFSRYENDRRKARHVFTTIAFHLGKRYPQLKADIAKIMKDTTVVDQGFQHHLQKLIVEPLAKRELPRFPPILIVLDALDECEDDIVGVLVDVLSNKWDGGNTALKFFVTSRPDRRLQVAYSKPHAQGKRLVLHEVHPPDIQADIRMFFENRLASIAELHNDVLPTGRWPSEDKVQSLVDKAGGLFIYASTVLHFIGSPQGSPSNRLEIILSASPATANENSYLQLDSLYTQILAQAGHKHFQVIVGTIIFLAQRLSVKGLSDLLGITSDDVIICLRPLHSVILVPDNAEGEVHAYHLSFHDFLTDNTRCRDLNLYIDAGSHQRDLALTCLARMSCSLKKDICGIGDASQLNSNVGGLETMRTRHIPAGLQYAILNWSTHIVQNSSDETVLDQLEAFFSQHTLHWIEALSILGKVQDGIAAIRQVSQWLPKTVVRHDLSALLHDTERMMLAFLVPISAAALQTYETGLAFLPRGTTLYRTLRSQGMKSSLQVLSGIRERWDQCLAVLEGHTDTIKSVMFSPDGGRIISCSFDKTIRAWDAKSGACSYVLEGHTDLISSFEFSQDGQTIISCSSDKTIRIWDAKLGACSHILDGHTRKVNSVAFSPDGEKIVSCSNDKTLRIWDPKAGTCSFILKGHTDKVKLFAFSPDGASVVSCSDDKTLRVWNMTSGACIHILEWHASNRIEFSRDGKKIGSCSNDKTLRIWDMELGRCAFVLGQREEKVKSFTFSPNGEKIVSSDGETLHVWDASSGTFLHALAGHTDSINSFSFSPDENQIVSCSDDKTLRVWATKTNGRLWVREGPTHLARVLEGHTHSVNLCAFSPDGENIVSCSVDKTLRVWDAKSGICSRVLEGHTDSVNSFVFSLDGEKIISWSNDKTLRIWDMKFSTSSSVSERHMGTVKSFVFSPDGEKIASSSEDKTLRVWNAKSGNCLRALEGHTGSVNSFMFSPEGEKIVSSSSDKTLRIWNTKSSPFSHILEEHAQSIHSFMFSPDGHKLVSCAKDRILRFWDLNSSTLLHTLEGHTDSVNAFEFLHDGEKVISCSDDETLRVWDVQLGSCLYVMKGHTDSVRSFKLSPNEKQIVSCSDDETLRIWDIKSSACLHVLEGHADSIKSFAFSPGGEKIVSCSDDETLRIWDVKSGVCSHILKGHRDLITSFIFSPNGQMLVSCSDDQTLRVWDVESGACSYILTDHVYKVKSFAFSPDGGKIISCSDDKTLRVWDTKSGACSYTLRGHTHLLSSKFFVLDKWLYLERMGNYHRICWFPEKPTTAQLFRDRLVVGNSSGQVVIMDISSLLSIQ